MSFLLLWSSPNNFSLCLKSEGVLNYRFLRPYSISITLYCFVPIRIDARLLVYKFSSLVFCRLNHFSSLLIEAYIFAFSLIFGLSLTLYFSLTLTHVYYSSTHCTPSSPSRTIIWPNAPESYISAVLDVQSGAPGSH